MEEDRSDFKIITVKPTRNRLLERLRRRWKKISEWNLKKEASIRGFGLIRLWIRIIGVPF